MDVNLRQARRVVKPFASDRENPFFPGTGTVPPKEVTHMAGTDRKKRHPIRFLIKVAVFGGLIYTSGRFIADKKDEYSNLNETQAKAKIIQKMSPKLGDETAREIADQVVPKLKEKGLVQPDPMAEAADDLKEAAEKVEDAADKVSEAVDSVVKD
jgi:hypothetical protein